MSTPPKPADHWNKIQAIARYVAYGTIAVMVLFVIALFGGEPFDPILRFIGFGYQPPGGVYADCSKPQNRNNGFCNRGARPSESGTWRNLKNNKGGAAFSLSER